MSSFSSDIVKYVIAGLLQVKEGTENRGSIESVVRVVRKTVCCSFILLLLDSVLLASTVAAAKLQTSAATSSQLKTSYA